jgi:peptide/nickel transport system substrate-binding protein
MQRLAFLLTAGLAAAAGTVSAQETAITLGMQLEPPHLDPTAGAAAAIDEVTYANVFEGLTRFAEDGSILPALAESWVIAPDGLSWEFTLREGVTFHDGTPMTAEDVVFSFDRAMAEESVNAQKALFDGINEVTAIDDRTVEIGLDAPKGSLLFNLAWGDAVIVSPASAETNTQTPVGTGPFRFDAWVQGDRVELVRNEDYWGEAPALERVTFKFIADPTAAFAAMMAGDIDAFPVFPAPENLAQFEADPRFAVIVGTTEGETILAMNHRREPFDDPKVRAGDRPCHRPAGDRRRRDVRLRHADRQPFRAAPPGLRRPDREPPPTTPNARRRCSPRRGTRTASRRPWRCRRPPMPGAAARSWRASCARWASRRRSSRWNGRSGSSRCSPATTSA